MVVVELRQRNRIKTNESHFLNVSGNFKYPPEQAFKEVKDRKRRKKGCVCGCGGKPDKIQKNQKIKIKIKKEFKEQRFDCTA